MYDSEIDIGIVLKNARLSLGYKRKKVASESGLSSSTIKAYEEDSVKYKLKNILKLCKVYNLNPKDLNIEKEKVNARVNSDTILIATYYMNNQVVDELEINKCRLFVNRDEFIYKGETKEEKIVANLYKNRIWTRQIGLGFDTTDIISLKYYKQLIEQPCYYCGKKNDQCEIAHKLFFYHNGIDRLDSTKGYTKDNSVSCCTKCNMAKGSLTTEEFLNLIDDIYINQKIKNSQK